MNRWKSASERFQENYTINENSGCWEWNGSLDTLGYGRIYANSKRVQAHRFSFELHRDPIPEGLIVCHRCDNRKCVNPKHLFLGTNADNVADRDAKGRQARGERVTESKLTADEVRAIRSASGISQRALAKQYGVSPTQIKDIQLSRYWKHLLNDSKGENECTGLQ